MKTKYFIKLLLITVLLFAFIVPMQPAQAGDAETVTFVVDTEEDLVDNMLNGICSAGQPTGGPCSLRAAISEASNIMQMNQNLIIELPEGDYNLTQTEEGPDDLFWGDLDFVALPAPTERWISIQGTGEDRPRIDGEWKNSRLLEIGRYNNVSISNVVMTRAMNDGDDDPRGGAVLIIGAGSVSFSHVKFSFNHVKTGENPSIGGAIFSYETPLQMVNCEFENNRADRASAIFNYGLNEDGAMPFSIYGTSFYFNDGKGSTLIESFGEINITNSSLGGESGDVILAHYGDGRIQNSTIRSDEGASAILGSGDFYLRNSIIYNTRDEDNPSNPVCGNVSADPDHPGNFHSEGGNVFTDNSCQPNTDNYDVVVPEDQVGVSNLIENRGPLSAYPLLPGSPAIHRRPEPCKVLDFSTGAPREFILVYDQLQQPRDKYCDAGSYTVINAFKYFPLILKE